ncbi:MAG: hypothetical protein A2719_01310 [Candidatus Ryanbacteria bacterium RIFCSPHIGHO2_01_FULL_45_22]|uniref:Uncharacterized protein n=2 Tax=Candidatus Ryaniibacteriota TaxID=1817914 RepID=A0A1G2G1H5_9BACT|nr:MAG: hypothetical protein A2719_01310 [Candidatus Ryanbacteria bacterium RIFCSPHIGHO2_01_FULL_45_22]OGZ46363.1 MAG: hypothetical protein A3J54_04195 [Candidatus Ryanbacteria bacterium RIFCSPHIGHO2_02_FULL_45_13b]
MLFEPILIGVLMLSWPISVLGGIFFTRDVLDRKQRIHSASGITVIIYILMTIIGGTITLNFMPDTGLAGVLVLPMYIFLIVFGSIFALLFTRLYFFLNSK